jgi:hypothetical protein
VQRGDAESGWRRALRGALVVAVYFVLAAPSLPAGAQDSSRPLKPSEAVHTQVYVSIEPVPRGRQFEVAAVAEVAEGYHVQANKVLADYLIPLTLTPELPAGFRVVGTEYPKAQVKKFPFAAQPMAVYEGRIVVRMTLETAAGVPTGAVKIPMTLRFQACNDQLCLPPAKLPLTAEFEVATTGAAAKSIHPEIFRKQ